MIFMKFDISAKVHDFRHIKGWWNKAHDNKIYASGNKGSEKYHLTFKFHSSVTFFWLVGKIRCSSRK